MKKGWIILPFSVNILTIIINVMDGDVNLYSIVLLRLMYIINKIKLMLNKLFFRSHKLVYDGSKLKSHIKKFFLEVNKLMWDFKFTIRVIYFILTIKSNLIPIIVKLILTRTMTLLLSISLFNYIDAINSM